MAKKDLELLIEKQFFKSDKILGTKLLNEIIVDSFFKGFQLDERASKKGATPVLKKQAGKRSISFSSLPDIAVSEIGWSSIGTGDEISHPVNSDQRAKLENYLKNIEGATLSEKVKSINKFYKFTSLEELEASGFLDSDSRSSKIQKVISYLVFLKTLTTIITNFNASAAGFAFESFLGVLLGGSQIATGGGTIADLQAGDGTYISLKLYAEKSVEVGGSYVDLVNDMADKPFIRYVVAMKSLSGKKLDLEGKISFYQFDINIDNIFDTLVKTSKHSRECIILPIDYIEGGGTDYSQLKKREVSDEEIVKFFDEKLANTFGKNIKLAKEIKALISGADVDYSKRYNVNLFNTTGGGKLGHSPANKSFIKKLVSDFAEEGIITEKGKEEVINALLKCFSDAIEFREVSSSTEEIENRFKQIKFATPEQSVAFYNSLKSKDDKINALKNSLGYLRTRQFSMTRGQVFTVIGGNKMEAEIVVGRKNIETIINQMAGILDEAIFEIFDSLSDLTTNINTFFATGLQDESAAWQAQMAAQNIDKKTEEVKGNAGQ